MAKPEIRADFEQISQPKPSRKMTLREIAEELDREPAADQAKVQIFPETGKMSGAKRLNKAELDKGRQFQLQDELEKMQKEMNSELNIAKKISKQLADGKEEMRAEKIREKYEPQITKLADELREMTGEKEGIEDLLPQLKKQTEESEDKRIAKIKEDREDKTDRLQKIPVTPELRAIQKRAAKKDVEDGYKRLVEAEDALAEAEKNRPGAISRFFSRLRISKLPAEVSAYQAAFQDESTPLEKLKKLEAAAIEASIPKASKTEIAYQQALRAVEEAKESVDQAEEALSKIEETSTRRQIKPRRRPAPEYKPPAPFTIRFKT